MKNCFLKITFLMLLVYANPVHAEITWNCAGFKNAKKCRSIIKKRLIKAGCELSGKGEIHKNDAVDVSSAQSQNGNTTFSISISFDWISIGSSNCYNNAPDDLAKPCDEGYKNYTFEEYASSLNPLAHGVCIKDAATAETQPQK